MLTFFCWIRRINYDGGKRASVVKVELLWLSLDSGQSSTFIRGEDMTMFMCTIILALHIFCVYSPFSDCNYIHKLHLHIRVSLT